MKRPVRVDQRENEHGEFWYTIRGGNGENTATSKMYRERWRATRAARAMIESLAGAAITFSYWQGPTPQVIVAARSRGERPRGIDNYRRVTERIR